MKKEFDRKDIKQDKSKIQKVKLSKNIEFEGEFYFELIDVDGQKLEHVGFRSKDGSFEDMMNHLPEMMELPQKAKIKVEIL
ncbi:MAG TPA: hypothetical protein VJ892_00155 [Candidatus Absconditabacterales bacterium]|nr:hypothetical protein [Candidatus Absconditabacterales bacterium]